MAHSHKFSLILLEFLLGHRGFNRARDVYPSLCGCAFGLAPHFFAFLHTFCVNLHFVPSIYVHRWFVVDNIWPLSSVLWKPLSVGFCMGTKPMVFPKQFLWVWVWYWILPHRTTPRTHITVSQVLTGWFHNGGEAGLYSVMWQFSALKYFKS